MGGMLVVTSWGEVVVWMDSLFWGWLWWHFMVYIWDEALRWQQFERRIGAIRKWGGEGSCGY